MKLLNGDCLKLLNEIDDNSVDLVFCDLPYGQTSCKWDCKIDLEKFWIEVMRIKKLNTPIFFTTTTKFGVDLINSAPKKCFFRYDIVWVKSSPVGFLSAKKMPMRKHEGRPAGIDNLSKMRTRIAEARQYPIVLKKLFHGVVVVIEEADMKECLAVTLIHSSQPGFRGMFPRGFGKYGKAFALVLVVDRCFTVTQRKEVGRKHVNEL